MSFFTPASKVIMRHSEKLKLCLVLFSGDLEDTLPARLEAADVIVHTNKYHYWQQLSSIMGKRCHFGLTADAKMAAVCDALIYYWPKNQKEAMFNLQNLLSILPIGTKIFIVGANRAGVRSSVSMIRDFGSLQKIDSASRCSLYYGLLEKRSHFSIRDWWGTYHIKDLTIATLPGVFGCDGLDAGSSLLLSSLKLDKEEKVLDIGCGSGVLSTVIARSFPKIQPTLTDVSAASLESSHATLSANNIRGEVIASDVYSNITGYFDIIVSNPPFHDGMQISLTVSEELIHGAPQHLKNNGKLCIVANAFLPYPRILNKVFGAYEVLAQTERFKVYLACLKRTAITFKN
ncbi:16S rRNA (guanine(1207)-N(2))-methyltransferase RsmC [Candidatus Profftia tarda]|uniref:Ribosomal RNA small subunit methyltransferase C n=1 Tax=Candidatus Profftia tarda TaxID=1177216 RepID=A0A8E4F0N5_9ENTR|nr:16S rRNA (guanine(1207)-N(2))-methyltransferase RsmC [Candidatus Profftia tarda]CAD6512951.1 Ribosomal RNA small subunit methyltransferase C [Candidatus Profftia tarda]